MVDKRSMRWDLPCPESQNEPLVFQLAGALNASSMLDEGGVMAQLKSDVLG
jgi:hypothetical protein